MENKNIDNLEDAAKELNDNPKSFSRRDVLKTLATIPVAGALGYGLLKKLSHDNKKRQLFKESFNLNISPFQVIKPQANGRTIRVGIIGYGGRGTYILRGAGFAEPEWIDDKINAAKQNKRDTRYQDFMEQDDLNIQITGICDVFEENVARGLKALSNIHKEGVGGKMGAAPKVYKTYQDLLKADDIDAVIIATPDHWHAPMSIAAAKAGKHVYCEKPMTWTVEETYEMEKVISDTGIVFQLGHQGRQIELYHVAKEVINQGLLGKINLIETCTNRSSAGGAWVYGIHPNANPQTIDWEQFIGPAPWHEFSLERFFRWRCWWDYSTGLNGDLLTHEYDAINTFMDCGIPYSAVCSGGIYYWKDGRTVPDVMQVAYEFPEKDFCLLYSATLASERNRQSRVVMGTDASLDFTSALNITADNNSERYRSMIDAGIINTNDPFYTYVPGQKKIDAVSTATERYFASRGLLYTLVGEKRYDTTFLHLREWLECIRQNGKTSCGIKEGFEEAITAHMATLSYHKKRTMYWDKDRREIVEGEPVKS